MGAFLRLSLALSVGSLVGCNSTTAPIPERPPFEIEIESVEQQAFIAVTSTPLEFLVPLKDADEAWGRAKLFFSQYTSAEGLTRELGPRTSEVVTETETTDPYRYSVLRLITPTGYRFSVKCAPNGGKSTTALAERNGKNLARFIREGTLEVSLLARE